jgi:hypothetical protein
MLFKLNILCDVFHKFLFAISCIIILFPFSPLQNEAERKEQRKKNWDMTKIKPFQFTAQFMDGLFTRAFAVIFANKFLLHIERDTLMLCMIEKNSH